jgi:hypothetical protein
MYFYGLWPKFKGTNYGYAMRLSFKIKVPISGLIIRLCFEAKFSANIYGMPQV